MWTARAVVPSLSTPAVGSRRRFLICYSGSRLSAGGICEAHVPAEGTSPEENARISQPHAPPGGSDGAEEAQGQGPAPPDRLTARSLTSEQFKATFREGARGIGEFAVVYVRPNGVGMRRIGVTVGRRFGNAVRRNRLRRRLREAMRDLEGGLPMGIDVVCTPRANAAGASFLELIASLRRALTEAGISSRPV